MAKSFKLLSPEEIEKQEKEYKEKRPVHYFFHETLKWKYYRLKRFFKDIYWGIRWRTIDRYNIIKISTLKPRYYDKDTILLHASFDLLVDFVEGECAHMEVICKDGPLYEVTKENAVDLGMKYLNWEISLKCDEDYGYQKTDSQYGLPTPQSVAAREIKFLYIWWKSYLIRQKEISEKTTVESVDEEDKLEQEADEMLSRLAKVRRHLWT